MSRVVIDDAHNYRMELTQVRRPLRRLLPKVPESLVKNMELYKGGKVIRTDFRTLWALIETVELRDYAVVKRLRHDLQWRFSGILGDPEGNWGFLGPALFHDYYLCTYPPVKGEEEKQFTSEISFEEMCTVAVIGAKTKEDCAGLLSEYCSEIAPMLVKIKEGRPMSPRVISELAGLECALGILKSAYDIAEDVASQRERIMSNLDYF